jgi:hypothetical protein
VDEMSEEQAVEATQEVQQEATQSQSQSATLLSTDNDGWYISDGVKGEGDRPDFLLSKHKTIYDQAKNYVNLEKKLGAHTGAPKEGYAIPEGYEPDDELVKQAIERAGKHGINQDAFNDIFELFSASSGVSNEITVEGEMAKLGDNAEQRIKTVESFLRNNAGDQFEELQGMVTSADSVALIEKMMSIMAPGKMPLAPAESGDAGSWADIEKAMMEKDGSGRLLRSSDPAYNRKVEQMIKDFHGE